MDDWQYDKQFLVQKLLKSIVYQCETFFYPKL